MKKFLCLSAFAGLFSSCGVNETMNSLEENRAAIDYSTAVIYENIQAIESANRGIEENRRQLEAINASLREANQP